MYNCEESDFGIITIDGHGTGIFDDAFRCLEAANERWQAAVYVANAAQSSPSPKKQDLSLVAGKLRKVIEMVAHIDRQGRVEDFILRPTQIEVAQNFTSAQLSRILSGRENKDLNSPNMAPYFSVASILRNQYGKPNRNNPDKVVHEMMLLNSRLAAVYLRKNNVPALFRSRYNNGTIKYHSHADIDSEQPIELSCTSPLRDSVHRFNQRILCAVLMGQPIPFDEVEIEAEVKRINEKNEIKQYMKSPATCKKKKTQNKPAFNYANLKNGNSSYKHMFVPAYNRKFTNCHYLQLLVDWNTKIFLETPTYKVTGNKDTGFEATCRVEAHDQTFNAISEVPAPNARLAVEMAAAAMIEMIFS
ncbi:hypothetical protein CO045_03805 [Candidatus Peregrinibacteria bacterium CG_4_9_14_0_2_um_filter_41_14]|nr:MAG: hypothetical protein CO045_03805 [Candidatus Peregrinibacteria bacterium CG_4_9_14_0_2_um_filter_41_14]